MLAEIADTGLSTTKLDIAARHALAGYAVVQREVPVHTLDTIWRRHVEGDIHFLKIDVEGGEADVLAGIDLSTLRPWVIVVEATAPLSCAPSHEAWEAMLLAAKYRHAHDDGLNRYYVAEEHATLTAAFAGASTLPMMRACELVVHDQSLLPAQRFDSASRSFLDLDFP